jgi:Xaa-Pro dipeptidase
MSNIAGVQAFMRDQRIDGWLVYDFRGNNTVFSQLLPGKRSTTRRAVMFIPAVGEPELLLNPLDADQFAKLPYKRTLFVKWQEFHANLERFVAGRGRIAMEYAPGGSMPVSSVVDAGTVEMVRAKGVEVVSSANLVQVSVAVWSEAAVREHMLVQEETTRIMKGAFGVIREKHAAGADVNEYQVQQWIMSRFDAAKLETPDGPIVAVNAHAGNPHFEVSATSPAPIKRGDWILIDLWARRPGDENIFSDITWVGYAGSSVQEKHRAAFNAVKGARDAAVACVAEAWKQGRTVQGWQVDDAARDVIVKAGFEKFIMHRTGHSLSAGQKVHGMGVNIDNLETHDTREVLPGIGFTVEPGVYTPEFGVRMEIDVYMDPKKGPVITSCKQDEPELV